MPAPFPVISAILETVQLLLLGCLPAHQRLLTSCSANLEGRLLCAERRRRLLKALLEPLDQPKANLTRPKRMLVSWSHKWQRLLKRPEQLMSATSKPSRNLGTDLCHVIEASLACKCTSVAMTHNVRLSFPALSLPFCLMILLKQRHTACHLPKTQTPINCRRIKV